MKKKLDDVLKNFEKEVEGAVSSERHLWENTKDDEIYNVDIHIWRKPGMGNSIQTIVGSEVSIYTATASFLATLLRKNVMSEETLDWMIDMVKNTVRNDVEDVKD